MIDFDLGDDLAMIRDTAERFARDQLAPNMREAERARGLAPELRRRFHELGLSAVELPEELGGAGLGALARAVVLEELAASDAGAAVALDPLGPALYPLIEFGGVAALSEHARPVIEDLEARAVLVFDDGRHLHVADRSLRGTVPWVPAERADLVVLLDSTGATVVREGIVIAPVQGSGLRAAGAAELRFEDAPIAARWHDADAAARALARARLYVAALLVGTLRAAAEYSRLYALDRVAFGRPIAHHQALAFLIADMRAAVDGARALLHDAAWRADAGLDFAEPAASAFAEAVEASMFVAPNGLQILGGAGFMQDYPVEKYMREARTLGLLLGGIDAARAEAGHVLAQTPVPVPLTEFEAGGR